MFGVLMINTLTGSACAESNGLYPNSALNAVEFNEVKIDDPFWNERIDYSGGNTSFIIPIGGKTG